MPNSSLQPIAKRQRQIRLGLHTNVKPPYFYLGDVTQEVNSPHLCPSGRLPAYGTADGSEVPLIRVMMAVLVLLPTATPAGVIATELEGVLRGVTKELFQETHRCSSSLPLFDAN